MMMNKQEHAFDWEELLLFIEERRVIPIIGKELLVIPSEDGDVLWEHHLAGRLATSLGLPLSGLPPSYDLNDVALLYAQNGGKRLRIYSKIKTLVEEESLPPPEALKKLAAITDFNLFVSTSFSTLLAKALDQVRFQGERKTKTLAYSTHSQIEDLPSEVRKLKAPYVYQLFGPLTSSAEYAVTEEDTLEFLHSLQSETRRPKILFDEFRSNHLLFLGCSFPDWLERFFVRIITNERLLLERETSQYIADRCTQHDHRLALFLRHYKAELFPSGSAVEFVDDLYRRWIERNASAETRIDTETSPISRKMEPGSIFLSYAHEDETAVRVLKEALEKAGLDVWFDEGKLQPGDAWDLEIRNNIRRCSLFLPLLSRNAQRRYEGYFRREWKWALERSQGMDDSIPFIQPVLLDDLPEGAPGVPEGFWSRQCIRFPGGEPSPDFVQRTRETIRSLRLREAGRL
jgi:hypothetical protein